MKKLVSLLLVLVMVFSLLPMSALAAEENVQTETEQSLETEGSVGTLLGNTLDGAGAMDEDTSSCSVTDISVDGKTATVEYQTDRAAELVVAIYEESTNRMLGSGHAVVSPDADTATVEITIDSMPSYFIVSAYLLDADGLEPLCDAFTSSYYTQEVTELRNKTAADFDEDRVLLLEEGNTDTNFLVFGEGTLLAEAGDSTNQITDNNDGTYTIVNADESFLALTEGDSFAYTYADGTVLVVVAASVKVDGTTVTVAANTEAELEDVFDYVKIEATSTSANASTKASSGNKAVYDDSTKDEDIEFNGMESAIDGEGSYSAKLSFGLEKKFYDKNDIETTLKCKTEYSVKASVCVYISRSYQYIDFSLKQEQSFSVAFSGKISQEWGLGSLTLPLLEALVYLKLELKLVLSISGEINITTTTSNKIGFTYDSNYGLRDTSTQPETKQPENSNKVGGKIYFGLKASIKLVIVGENVVQTYLSGEVGFELSLEECIADDDDSSKHDCLICFEGDLSVKVEFKLGLKMLYKYIVPETTLLSIKPKLFDVYYSAHYNEFGFTTCPHKSYKLTVSAADQDDKAVDGAVRITDKPTGEILKFKDGVINSDGSESLMTTDGKAEVFLPNGEYTVTLSHDGGTKAKDVTVLDRATKVNLEVASSMAGGTVTGPTEADGEIIDSGTCGEDVRWALYESGLLYISGTGDMGDYASDSKVPWYKNRTQVKKIEICEGVTSVGDYAFSYCEALENVIVGKGVTSIGRSAFIGSKASADVYIADVVAWCNIVFETNDSNPMANGCDLYIDDELATEITIPDGVTSVGNSAFSGCTSLVSVTIPDGVTSVGNSAFSGCTSLVSVTISDSVTSFGIMAFYNCTALTSISLPDSVTSIGSSAFEGCTSLVNVTIPDSVTSIGGFAFNNCTSLASITIPDNVTSIGSSAFRGCISLTSITIPDNVASIGDNAFRGCTSLTSITVDGHNDNYCSANGVLFNRSKTELVCFPAGKPDTAYCVPAGVTSIGSEAFYGCATLTSVTIPDSVVTIEFKAFCNCTSLISIIVPDSVTSIGQNAFNNCASLARVTLPNSVTRIEPQTFYGCASLTSIIIPDSVTSITTRAFYNCTSLKSVTVGSGMTSIGLWAFYGCKALSDVYYTGTETQWKAISIGSHNTYLTNATKHYNYDQTSTVTLDEAMMPMDEVMTGITIGEIPKETTAEETANEEATKEKITEETTTEEVTTETTTEETTEENTSEEKTTYEADEIELLAAYTGAIDGSTASFTGLVPNERYVLLVMKDAEAADPLAAENLLYIVQGVSSETGALSFVYVPREEVESAAAVVYGAGGIDVSHAIITIGVAVGGAVVVKVELDGETLIEDEDYRCTVATGDNGMISVTIVGMDSYYGTALATLDHTPGDMDGKDGVTILDVLALLKAVAGIADKPAHADVNGDGDVTILDVLTLLKYVAGISGTTIY